MNNSVETTVCFFKDLNRTLSVIPDADAGALMKALFAHANGEEPKLAHSPVAAALYVGVSDQMDRLAEYRKGKSRGASESKKEQTRANECKQPQLGYPNPNPYPNKEKEIQKKEKVSLPDTGIWADEKVRAAFADYAKMRIRIRKAMTPDAVKRKIPKLESMTSDTLEAVEIIQRATDNCWLDFYADREKKQKKPQFNFDQRNTDYDALLNGA